MRSGRVWAGPLFFLWEDFYEQEDDQGHRRKGQEGLRAR